MSIRAHRRSRSWLRAGVLAAVWLLVATAASAQISVFQSPRDDLIPGTGPAEIRGPTQVHVGFDNGSFSPIPGQACGPQGGDEICQWAVRFETTGNVKIIDVAWAPGVVEDDEPTDPAMARSGTGGNSIQGEVSGTRIATVTVAGTRGELRLVTPPSFGFLASTGAVLGVDPAGVVVARAPQLGWSRLSAKGSHTCGALTNGELRCVGPLFSSGAPPSGAYAAVAVGPDYGCVLDFDQQIACWGSLPPPPSPSYLAIASGEGHMCGLLPSLEAECWGGTIGAPAQGPFRVISRGGGHACGIRLDSTVVCWGDDGFGQVSLAPPDEAFTEIAGGGAHTCAIRADGTPACWGDNSFSQSAPPFPSQTYTDISAGDRHTCAIRTEGPIDCWGDGSSGQTNPPAGEVFQALTVADTWGCGIRSDGGASCWGTGVSGSDVLPVPARPQVATGPGHSCQVGSDRSLRCWTADSTLQAALVGTEPPGAYTQIESDDAYACALGELGAIACWGTAVSGRTLPPNGAFTQITVGTLHGCALRPDATAECWGEDGDGQASPPGGSFELLAAGDFFTCGLRPDKSAECWGRDTVGETSPAAGPFVDLAAGATHACGVRAMGDVVCWGSAGGASVPPMGMFKSIDVGPTHSCGVRTQDDADCFGDDAQGESTPPSVAFAAISVQGDSSASPFAHSCGVATQGSLACWGSSFVAQTVPPLDADGDGLEDPIDNCPATPNPDQLDGDADGAGDVCDTCPIFDPDQYDRDGDGVGDICDACPDSPTASAPGSTCETTVSLVPTPMNMTSAPAAELELQLARSGVGSWRRIAASMLERMADMLRPLLRPIEVRPAYAQAAQPAYDLVLACPVAPIGRIELALILPSEIDPTTLDFGPGCLDLPIGCSNATLLDSSVDPDQSFLLLPPVPGGRPEAFYFALVGRDDVTTGLPQLCDVGDVKTLATILVNQFPSDGSNPALSPELVENVSNDMTVQMATQAAGVAFDGDPIQKADGTEVPFAQYAFSVGANNAPIELELRPSLNDTTGANWDINVDSQNEIFRATLGFIAPVGTTSISLAGTGPTVDSSSTTSVGPAAGLPRTDTLYVTFQGSLPGNDPLDPTLVPAGGTTTLGTLVLGNPNGQPPVITLEGAAQVAGLPPGSPFEEPGGTLLDGDQALLTGAGSTGEDFDGDGVQNNTDNCVFTFNPTQDNNGGFLTSVADNFGDDCQCGDLDFNGQILDDGSDLLALRQVVAGNDSSTNALALCSVSDSPDCNIKDVIVLERALAGQPGPAIASACLRAIPSGGGGDN